MNARCRERFVRLKPSVHHNTRRLDRAAASKAVGKTVDFVPAFHPAGLVPDELMRPCRLSVLA
jgi:hypothetical protein